jgi:hypothetical protein
MIERDRVYGALKYSANVDYFSATTEMRMDVPKLEQSAEQLRALSLIAGGVTVPASSQGYRGWRCGSLFFGVREDGAWLEARGGLADEAYERTRGVGLLVSRLDVALTVWFVGDTNYVIQRVKRMADNNWRGQNKKWPAKPRYVDGMGEGDTFYVGAAGGKKMLRLYEKGVESGEEEYAGALRWEVQFRHERAKAAYKVLRASSFRIRKMVEVVTGEYQVWGVPYPYVDNVEPAPVLISYRGGDLDTKLRWFRDQVIPGLEKMGYHNLMHEVIRSLIDTAEGIGYTKPK